MKKTFDQLFSEIVGENLMQPAKPNTTAPTPGQNTAQQPAQPSTPQQQQGSDIKTISAQLAKLTDADEIEKVLAQLLTPNAANKPA